MSASTPLPVFTLPVDPWIKFSSTTVGRDKLYRTVQYAAKLVAHHLSADPDRKELVERLSKLSAAVGMARKLFRVGKPIDFVQTILKSVAIKDDVVRVCAIGRSVFLAGWLSLDIFQWLHAQGVYKLDDIKRVNTTAARCWFTGLLFAVAADLYRLRNTLQRIDAVRKMSRDDDHVKKELATLKKERTKVLWECAQDGLDLLIPGSALEYIPAGPGMVALAGTITSLIGWQAAWPKA